MLQNQDLGEFSQFLNLIYSDPNRKNPNYYSLFWSFLNHRPLKNLCFTAVFLLFTSFSISQDLDLTGSWEDERLQIVYRFEDDENLYFSQQGYGVFAKYELESSYEPYRMELIMRNGPQEVRIPALLKVIDENTIWIEQFPPGHTPVEFTEGEKAKLLVHKLVRI